MLGPNGSCASVVRPVSRAGRAFEPRMNPVFRDSDAARHAKLWSITE